MDFPGYGGEGSLKQICRETWFEQFDENDLAFLHQDKTDEGQESRFFKFIHRHGSERDRALNGRH